MTIQINDPWFESLYRTEFGANSTKFLETIKSLLIEKNQREKRVVALLNQYKNAEISIGKIAENLNISREEVLELLSKYNIDFVDYSWEEEQKNVNAFLSEIQR